MIKPHYKKITYCFISLAIIIMLPATALAVSKFEECMQAGNQACIAHNYPEAEHQFEMAVKEAAKFKKTDPRLGGTLYNLALVYNTQEKYEQAESTYKQALELLINAYGAVSSPVGQVYLDLAGIYATQEATGDRTALRAKASESFQKAISLFEEIYKNTSDNDIKAAKIGELLNQTLKLYGDFYMEDNEFSKAEPIYKKQLDIEKQIYGPQSKPTIEIEVQLAEFYDSQEKYRLAFPLFQEALSNSLKTQGMDSFLTANIYFDMGKMYLDQDNFSDAEKMLRSSITILEKLNYSDKEDLASKKSLFADTLDTLKKTDEADSIFKQAINLIELSSNTEEVMNCLKLYRKHLLLINKPDEAHIIAEHISKLRNKPKIIEEK